MRFLRITLHEDEERALEVIARKERRRLEAQAAVLLREALKRHNVLSSESVKAKPERSIKNLQKGS